MDTTYLILIVSLGLQFCCLTQVQAVTDPLHIATGPDGSYNISVEGVTWFRSAPAFFVIDGTRYSADDGSLHLVSINTTISGEGVFGVSISTDFHYNAGGVPIIASVVFYNGEMLTFKVRFVTGATNTSQENLDGVICGFPGFHVDSMEQLGFLSFGGEDLGFHKQTVGRWNHSADIQDGLEGSSPLSLFDSKGHGVTFGPLDNFMSTVMWHDRVNNFLYWGTMGGVSELPANFSYQILAGYSNSGISSSFQVWGFIMLEMYYKLHRSPDSTANGIGYWTDEGSYYFEQQGPTSYEDILVEVFEDAYNNSISYSYVEWDTWWFTKGSGGGVREWTAPSDVFPHGEKYLQSKINVPIFAKNSFWSSDNIYAKQNGGIYSFEIVDDMAIPTDEAFWDYIFSESKKWGLATYIQDNMTETFRNFPQMKTDVNFGRDWLMKMARSAQRNNITIQYSGALPRIALEAAELPAVTQFKVSSSFEPSSDQWKIGLTSIFGNSLQTYVFKDIFLTTPDAGSAQRESVVSTLSSGLLGIGDQIGHTNTSILYKTCAADGTILKPNAPARVIYPQLQQMAFQDGSGPDGEVWATFSSVSKGGTSPEQQYAIIFVSGLKTPFNITPTNTGITFQYPKSKIFSRWNPQLQHDYSDDKPFTLPVCVKVDFCLYYTSPVIDLQSHEVLILGELDKWVPISNKRVSNITVTDSTIYIHVQGQTQERVRFYISTDGKVSTLNTEIGNSGHGILVYQTQQLSSSSQSPKSTTATDGSTVTSTTTSTATATSTSNATATVLTTTPSTGSSLRISSNVFITGVFVITASLSKLNCS